MTMNVKDRRIVIGVLAFSAVVILGIGFGFGFAHRKSLSSSSSDKTSGVQTTSKPPITTTTTSRPYPTPGANAGNKFYKNGAVATDAGKCSEIGRDILQKGGSAVDAAIASSLCIGVVNMHSAGIGGGGFMLVYNNATGTAETLDYREEAPKNATQDMFQNISSTTGGKATGIPGEIKGLHWAYKRYGKLAWKDLVQPSINLARDGFPFPIPVHEAAMGSLDSVKADYGLRDVLFVGDKLKNIGDLIQNPQLAITMEKIRDDPESFYTGCLADDIVRDVQRAGGIITKDDLKNYKPKWKAALQSELDNMGLNFFATAPPSSGAVITMILNILKGYNMTQKAMSNDDQTGLTYHRIIEAFKYSYAWRSKLGDPDFNSTDTSTYTDINRIVKNMTDPIFAEKLRALIEDDKTYYNVSHYGSNYDSGTGPEGTSHLSILAANGDAVSLTTTINFRFGAKYRSPVTGIIYNNEMDDFSTPGKPNGFGVRPSPSNYIKAGKRPMSSMCPIIFVRKADNAVRLIAGASGGTRITTATSLVVMNELWFGFPLNEAVSRPRVHNQLSNTTYEVKESRYTISASIRKQLASRGNRLLPTTSYAVVQAISRKDSAAEMYAQSDPRKHGWAAGY